MLHSIITTTNIIVLCYYHLYAVLLAAILPKPTRLDHSPGYSEALQYHREHGSFAAERRSLQYVQISTGLWGLLHCLSSLTNLAVSHQLGQGSSAITHTCNLVSTWYVHLPLNVMLQVREAVQWLRRTAADTDNASYLR